MCKYLWIFLIIIANNWITDCSGVMQEITKPCISISQDKDAGNSSNASEIRPTDTSQMKKTDDDSSVPLSQSCTINEKLLGGMIEDLYSYSYIFIF